MYDMINTPVVISGHFLQMALPKVSLGSEIAFCLDSDSKGLNERPLADGLDVFCRNVCLVSFHVFLFSCN
jgi:hypothetical protein